MGDLSCPMKALIYKVSKPKWPSESPGSASDRASDTRPNSRTDVSARGNYPDLLARNRIYSALSPSAGWPTPCLSVPISLLPIRKEIEMIHTINMMKATFGAFFTTPSTKEMTVSQKVQSQVIGTHEEHDKAHVILDQYPNLAEEMQVNQGLDSIEHSPTSDFLDGTHIGMHLSMFIGPL